MSASARRQFNCRPDEETWELIEEARRLGSLKLGLEVADVQILKRAVARLVHDWRDLPDAPPDATSKPAKKR